MADLEASVGITGQEQLVEAVQNIEKFASSFVTLQRASVTALQGITQLVSQGLNPATTAINKSVEAQQKSEAANLKNINSIRSLSSAWNANAATLAELTDSVLVQAQASEALLATTTSLTNSNSEYLIGARESVIALQALNAASANLEGQYSRLSALTGERMNLESGATRTMQERIATENALLLVERERSALSKADVAAINQEILATAELTAEQRENVVVAMKLATAYDAVAVAAKADAVSEDEVAAASVRSSTARSTQISLMRGAAGAAGSLWMSYGQLIPIMGAYAAIASTIGAIKLSAHFEYDTAYIESMEEASGKASMSLDDLRGSLLSLSDLRDNVDVLARGMQEFTRSGISATDALKVMPTVDNMAKLGNIELSTAIATVIGQANAFAGDAGPDYVATANKIAAAAFNANATLKDYSHALAQVTELGSAAKISQDQVYAGLAAITKAGIDANKASVALRSAILHMEAPSTAFIKMLKEMGVSWSAFSKAATTKDLGQMFGDLDKALSGLPDENKIAILKELFGLRSLKGGAAMLREWAKSYQEVLDKIHNSNGDTAYIDKLQKGVSSTALVSWEKLWATIENLATSVSHLGPIQQMLKGLDSALSGVVHEINHVKPTSLEGQIKDYEYEIQKLFTLKQKMSKLKLSPHLADQFPDYQSPARIDKQIAAYQNQIDNLKILISLHHKDAAAAADASREKIAADKAYQDVESAIGALNTKNTEARMSAVDKLKASWQNSIDQMELKLKQSGKSLDVQKQKLAEYTDKLENGAAGHLAMAKAIETDNAAARKLIKAFDNGSSTVEKFNDRLRSLSSHDKSLSKLVSYTDRLDARFSKFGDDAQAALKKLKGKSGTEGAVNSLQDLINKSKEVEKALIAAFNTKLVHDFDLKLQHVSASYDNLSAHDKALQGIKDKFQSLREEADKNWETSDKNSAAYATWQKEIDKVNAAEQYVIANNLELAKTGTDAWRGFVAGMKEAQLGFETLGEFGYKEFQDMSDGFQTIFVDALKLDFGSIKDDFKSLLDSMLSDFLKFLAQLAEHKLLNWVLNNTSIGSWFASGSGSSGGSGVGGTVSSLVTSYATKKAGSYLENTQTGKAVMSYFGGSGGAGTSGGTAGTALAGEYASAYGSGALSGGSTGMTGALSAEYNAYGANALSGYGNVSLGSELGSTGGSVGASGGTAGASGGTAGAAEGSSSAGAGAASSTIGAVGTVATVAYIAYNIFRELGEQEGPSLKRLMQVNKVSPAQFSGGFSNGYANAPKQMRDILDLAREYNNATYDMKSGLLALTQTSNTATTGIVAWDEATRKFTTQAPLTIYSVDKTTGEFVNMSGTLRDVDGAIIKASSSSKGLTAVSLEQIAAQHGIEGATSSLIRAYMGQQAATFYLAQVSQGAGAAMAAAATDAAAALGQIHNAAREAATTVITSDHGIPYTPNRGGGGFDGNYDPMTSKSAPARPGGYYHATGGVFDRRTQIGNQVFGEAGPEILAPLPGGANALSRMAQQIHALYAKLASSEASQPVVIQVTVNSNSHLDGKVIDKRVDNYVVKREMRPGVTGRRVVV